MVGSMVQHWYVVNTYSGYENRAKKNLEERIRSLGKGEFFSEILVPTETVVELVKGKRKTSQRKIFPGYILVKMELNEETWHIVKDTPKITGFAGDGTKPIPISGKEVEGILSQMKEGVSKAKPKVSFSIGDSVRVIDDRGGQAGKEEAEGSGFYLWKGDSSGARFYPGGKELAFVC
jgi:transcriptional antiterminator NusG